MFARFERVGSRISVQLVVSHRTGKKVRAHRVGPLGSVLFSDPISISERARFWASVGDRFRALAARYPGRISPADEERIRTAIAKRIPRPCGEAEVRLLRLAAVQREVAAIDNLDGAEDVFAEVARRLQALTRETRPQAEAAPLK
jgi:hypothetical protein